MLFCYGILVELELYLAKVNSLSKLVINNQKINKLYQSVVISYGSI